MAEKAQPPSGQRDRAPEVDVDTVKADIEALRAELATVVQAIKDLGSNAVATAKRQQGAALGRLSAEATSLGEELVRAGKTQTAELEERIRQQPLAAVGIAFVVGLVVGTLRR